MITEIYYVLDNFCKNFLPEWEKHLITSGLKKRNRKSKLSCSEIMTILILFHQSQYRNFKHFYIHHVEKYLRADFPDLVSYSRFISLQKSVLIPLCYFLHTFKGEKTGIYFIDSTTLKVCHIKREHQNKVFKGLAAKSKSTTGWFYGFKLHLVINDKGEVMACKLTSSRTDDRCVVDFLTKELTGKLIGDKGYIKRSLSEALWQRGLQLITKFKKNMNNMLVPLIDKILLRKRAVIESVNDQLKNISQIEHTRHRSVFNFISNVFCGLIAYCFQPKKPTINWNKMGLFLEF